MRITPHGSSPKLVSLRRHFLWLLIGVIGLFAAGMALNLRFSLQFNEDAEMRLLQMEAKQTLSNVVMRWGDYRALVDNLADAPELPNLMQTGSPEEMQAWTLSRQYLLPGILGLALVSPRGEVLGDAKVQRVAPSCQHDLRLDGSRKNQQAVHRDMPGLEHVDMVAMVRGPDGGELGKVFVSVRLTELQQVIDDSIQPGHAITIFDAAGQPVAASGELQEGAREIGLPFQTLGWRLVAQSPIHHFDEIGVRHILAGMLTLAGVLVLLVVVVLRLRQPVLQDIDAALDALACLTRDESPPPIVTRYIEFADAAESINRIALHLHDQREQLDRLSHTDSLTGLPNRRAFETRFPHMLGLAERGRPTALVLLDLDLFKTINDQLGHAAGDQALIALANTLKALTRSSDMAARLAGDEFVVLLSGLDNQGMLAWYQRMADHFNSELRAAGLNIGNTISAGQTWLQDEESDNIGQALARADRALYQAKERGRGQLVFAAALPEKDTG
jgi:diguanylate cyclase (GGDEF)-like protein